MVRVLGHEISNREEDACFEDLQPWDGDLEREEPGNYPAFVVCAENAPVWPECAIATNNPIHAAGWLDWKPLEVVQRELLDNAVRLAEARGAKRSHWMRRVDPYAVFGYVKPAANLPLEWRDTMLETHHPYAIVRRNGAVLIVGVVAEPAPRQTLASMRKIDESAISGLKPNLLIFHPPSGWEARDATAQAQDLAEHFGDRVRVQLVNIRDHFDFATPPRDRRPPDVRPGVGRSRARTASSRPVLREARRDVDRPPAGPDLSELGDRDDERPALPAVPAPPRDHRQPRDDEDRRCAAAPRHPPDLSSRPGEDGRARARLR